MRHLMHPRRLAAIGAAAVTAGVLTIAGTALAATVNVSVGNYYFEDATVGDGKVTATVGDQLRFTVVEGAGHTVTISALGIDSGQLPMGAVYVTPKLTTPGTYSLICTTHRARNHATTLVVLAASGGGGGGGGSATTTTAKPTVTTAATTTTAPGATVPGDTTSSAGSTGVPATSISGSTASTPADGTATSDSATAGSTDSTAEGELPVGVTVDDSTPWMRGVWVALVALPLFAAIGAAADLMSRDRAAAASQRDDETPTDLERP